MSYYFSRTISASQEDAIRRVTEALGARGFGVLSSIDVAATLKSKLGVEFRPYTILGACNPQLAWQALQEEDKIGTMLPCNVIVTELVPGVVEVAAVDPVASMASVMNPRLEKVAEKVRLSLREVVEKI
jgi:uncharacterized protein (DUF302 family)